MIFILFFRGYYIRMKALEYAFNMFYTVYDQKEVQVNLRNKKFIDFQRLREGGDVACSI